MSTVLAAGQPSNNNNSSNRLDKTTACLPVVYGSVAFYLGKKADEFQTHQWTLYVRGPNNEDLSGVITKVIFTLHASFAQPTRELDSPPFEVTERGWGEFEAQIRIIWKEPTEKPTLLTHGIKLYPAVANPNSSSSLPPPTDMDTPVIAESYDEVVFTNPTELFYKQLLQVGQLEPIPLRDTKVQTALSANQHYTDEETFLALLEAKKFLQQELVVVKERFQIVDSETKQVEEAIREIQERNKARKAQQQQQQQQQAQAQQQAAQQQQRTSTSSKKQKT